MFRTITFAVAAALATDAAASNAISIVDGTTAHIRYDDINLRSATGQGPLGGRIRKAAEMICTDGDHNLVPFSARRVACYRAAVADGFSQMREIAAP
jgi:UrcA family protein